jgi:hypothetical protein
MKKILATAAFIAANLISANGQDEDARVDALQYFHENFPVLQYERFVGPFRLTDNPDDKRIIYFNEEGAENGRQAKRRVMIFGMDDGDGEFTTDEITMITIKQDQSGDEKITEEIQMNIYPDGSVAET